VPTTSCSPPTDRWPSTGRSFCTPHPKVAGSRRCLGNTGSETLIDMVVGKTSRGLWLVQDLDVKPGQGWTDADPDAIEV
jgi:hypothetical protein